MKLGSWYQCLKKADSIFHDLEQYIIKCTYYGGVHWKYNYKKKAWQQEEKLDQAKS